MEKIRVSICTCPACYTAAATHFKLLNGILNAKMKTGIVLSGNEDCAAACGRQAPFVQMDDRQIDGATPGDVIHAIRETLRRREAGLRAPLDHAA